MQKTDLDAEKIAKAVGSGFGLAAKLAAKGFAGMIIGGVKLTFGTIIPSAMEGVTEVIQWSKKK